MSRALQRIQAVRRHENVALEAAHHVLYQVLTICGLSVDHRLQFPQRRVVQRCEFGAERVDLFLHLRDAPDQADPHRLTIGAENPDARLSDFTLVTASYEAGDLKGVIGVMGPTRMPYDKIIGLVEHTSRMVEDLLE